MKYLLMTILVTTLLACGGEPGYHEPADTRNAKLFSTTWELSAIDDQSYNWEAFYKVYYTFSENEVELQQYDAKTKQIKFKTTGKWKWKSFEDVYLDFRLPNGNGEQFNWKLLTLERTEIRYRETDGKTYLLIPKK